jgi:hypothetical protein
MVKGRLAMSLFIVLVIIVAAAWISVASSAVREARMLKRQSLHGSGRRIDRIAHKRRSAG